METGTAVDKVAERMEKSAPFEPLQTKFNGEIQFLTLSPRGDDRVTWNRQDQVQIEAARRKFYEMIDKGFMAYSIGLNGKRSDVIMHHFDRNAEGICFVPLLVGG